MSVRAATTLAVAGLLLTACGPLPIPGPAAQSPVAEASARMTIAEPSEGVPIAEPTVPERIDGQPAQEMAGEQPTFALCGREPAAAGTTNLRPSDLTDADRAAVQAWEYGPIPDGRVVLEHVTDLALPVGMLGFGNGYEAAVGGFFGDQLREVAAAGTIAPVTLAVLDSPTGRRVAFVEVRVGAGTPVRWEEDPALGFGTDGGDGGVWAPTVRGEGPVDDQAAFDSIDAMFPAGDVYGGDVCVLRSTSAGVDGVDFSAGYGDGGYPTFVGYGDADHVVSVVSYGFVIPWALSGLPGTPPSDADL